MCSPSPGSGMLPSGSSLTACAIPRSCCEKVVWRRGTGRRSSRAVASTLVPSQRGPPEDGSDVGSSRVVGLTPRPVAKRPKSVCPCPRGIATTPGLRFGSITTVASTAPWSDSTVMSWPSAAPIASAVSGDSSAQLLQAPLVIASGISWSQGRFAPRPS